MELEAGKLDVVFLDYMTVLSYADAKEDLAAVDLGIPETSGRLLHRRQEGEHGAGRVHQRRSGGAEGAETAIEQFIVEAKKLESAAE